MASVPLPWPPQQEKSPALLLQQKCGAGAAGSAFEERINTLEKSGAAQNPCHV